MSGKRVPAPPEAFRHFALAVLVCVAAVELVNTARIFIEPLAHRRFPQDYVSKGIWAGYALVRPPDATSTDLIDPLRAAQRLLARDGEMYAGFNGVAASYVYPPTAAVLLAPFGWVADRAGIALATQCVDIVGRLGALVILLVTLRFLRGMLATRWDWLLGAALVLAFFPLRWALFCVQIQSLINAFVAGALLGYAHRRRVLCGVLLGLAAGFKPHWAALALFAVARRSWKTAIAMTVTGSALIAISLALVGMAPWETYVHDVLPLMATGYAWERNQSFLALARRWAADPYVFASTPTTRAVILCGYGAAVALLAVSVLPRSWRRRPVVVHAAAANLNTEQTCWPPGALTRAADLGIAALALTMASPIAWEHHYGWTVVLVCICLSGGLAVGVRRTYLALLGASYVLLATDWIAVAAGHGGPRSLLDSPKLLAAVLLTVLAWRACTRLRAERGAT